MKVDTTSNAHSFAQVKITIVDGGGPNNGEFYAKGISYGDKISSMDVRGNSPVALSSTVGEYAADDGNIDLYLADFYAIQDKLGTSFYEKRFTVTVSYAALSTTGALGDTFTDTLVGCRFTSRPQNHQSGGDALTVQVGLKPQYIKFSGKAPFSVMPKGLS